MHTAAAIAGRTLDREEGREKGLVHYYLLLLDVEVEVDEKVWLCRIASNNKFDTGEMYVYHILLCVLKEGEKKL